MSELTEKGDANTNKFALSAPQAEEVHRLPDDWEERLAVARAKREQVLRARGKQNLKPMPGRSRFPKGDTEEAGLPRAALSANASPALKTNSPTADPSKAIDEDERIVASLRETFQSVDAQTGKIGSGYLVRLMTVAFACFFGLGFGMVLSFGIVTAMGWVSLSEIGPLRAPAPAVVTPGSPEILTAAIAGLDPDVAAEVQTKFDHSELAPVSAGARSRPERFASVAADKAPVAIQSPGPRFGAKEPAIGFGLISDNPASALSVVSEDPVEVAGKKPDVPVYSGSDDSLPTVPERSTVTRFTVLASLGQPPMMQLSRLSSFADDKSLVLMPAPQLLRKPPEDVLTVSWKGSQKPDALVVGPLETSPDGDVVVASLTDPDVSHDIQVGETSPVTPLPGEAPVAPSRESLFESPGASVAVDLGLSRQDTALYNLATFAPSNVPETSLLRNAELLRETGFPVATPERVDFKVSKTHVRYYHRADETVARAVAARIGGPARDFTASGHSAPVGYVEVWLEGDRSTLSSVSKPRSVAKSKPRPVTATKPGRTPSEAERVAARKSELEKRLVDSLRRGDHLAGGTK